MNSKIKRLAQIELAKRFFWEYCKLVAPDFYQEGREFLKDFCNRLQDFYEDDSKKILVVNMPPRHGKSRTGALFTQWLFGHNRKAKIMTGSYNESLSGTFAKQVRDKIAEERTEGVTVYNDVFPLTRIKHGEGKINKWSLEGSAETNYLATSPTGTATGFGASLIIVDDLIKNAEEAYNATVLEKQKSWFYNTMLSRTEKGFKLIIIMTRWATNDLAGDVLERFTNVEHVNYKAVSEEGNMLCEDILSKEDYEFKTQNMNKDIVFANYQQEPIDIKGRLYEHFKIYDGELPQFKKIANYTDTADEGSDYLCSICYGVTFSNEAYVLDVYYTKEPMEVTEKAMAKRLVTFRVNQAKIESNNGGRGFARNVERLLREMFGSNRTVINWFHQNQNKTARILSNSSWVMEHIYFPADWRNKWPEYYDAMIKYQREGKNAHDDAPDATTGIAENIAKSEIQATRINY